LKRAENKVEAAGGMWFNNNESNNWESDHSTYFGLYFNLFEHLELLEPRATLTAGKTMLFCVVYSRKKIRPFWLSVLIWLDFGSESPKTCDTLLNGSLQFYCFILCHVLIDILVLNVFCIKPTFCEHSLREDRE